MNELISVSEAATRLNLTDSYIRRLLREGKIEGRKINDRAWVVSKSSVEQYASAHKKRGEQ